MNRRELVRSLLLGALTPAFGGCATPPASSTGPISEALAATTTPGIAAIVIRDFRAEPELVSGVRSIGSMDRVTPGQRWHLGSNGKAMTATLVAGLVDARALAWDRPLSAMLPELAESMQPVYRDVTLPDLLSHRAGLPENIGDPAFFATFYDDSTPLTAQRLRYIAACLGAAPVGPVRAAPHIQTPALSSLPCALSAPQTEPSKISSHRKCSLHSPCGR
jgi:CubicO group peptidase (beta-lactamase class C family)